MQHVVDVREEGISIFLHETRDGVDDGPREVVHEEVRVLRPTTVLSPPHGSRSTNFEEGARRMRFVDLRNQLSSIRSYKASRALRVEQSQNTDGSLRQQLDARRVVGEAGLVPVDACVAHETL